MLALLKRESGRVRGRVFSYARLSPACAILASSLKLKDPPSDPSCWPPTAIIALGCERGVPFSGGFGAKAQPEKWRVKMQTYLLKSSHRIMHWLEQRNA